MKNICNHHNIYIPYRFRLWNYYLALCQQRVSDNNIENINKQSPISLEIVEKNRAFFMGNSLFVNAHFLV